MLWVAGEILTHLFVQYYAQITVTFSVVINPNSRHYDFMRCHMHSSFADDYFGPDAIQMEMNSRDFASRVNIINANTRAVCDFLRSRSLSFVKSSLPESGSAMVSSPLVIKDVYYPEWITPENYGTFRRPGKDDNFGPLFSVTFISQSASEAFYNALPCAKGPSLGTDFTLACPYTILAHFQELDWAAEYGIEEGIVRVSVGMEERETLVEWFRLSLKASEMTLT
jgi:cystathionine gamma-synthase